MRSIYAIMSVLLLASVASAQTPASDAAYAQALKEGKSLAAFIGCKPTPVPIYALAVRVDSLPGYEPNTIALFVHKDGKMVYHSSRPAGTDLMLGSEATARKYLEREAVKASPSPFSEPLKLRDRLDARREARQESAVADDSDIEKYLGNAKPYKRATMTQEIATTNNRPRITPRSRLDVENSEWHQSGGMLGVKGWRSIVYKEKGAEPFQARIPVLNSFGYYQNELGWVRRYPDGTKFFDRLINEKTGKTFELRQAVKEDGAWKRTVVYRDKSQYPDGYTGLNKSCASCHNNGPGTGNYAGPLATGSDGIFSDPVPALE